MSAPHYLIPDRDRIYGEAFTCSHPSDGHCATDRQRRDHHGRTGDAERLIGSIRRECLDHVIVCGERHLRYVLRSYARYYNGVRTHLSLAKARPYPEPSRQLPCFGTRETKHDLLPVSGWGEERRGGGAGAFRFPVRTPFPGPLVPFSLARFPVRSDQVPSRRASCPSGFQCCPAKPLTEHAAAQAGPHICLKSRQIVALGQHLDDLVSNAWNRVILFTARKLSPRKQAEQ